MQGVISYTLRQYIGTLPHGHLFNEVTLFFLQAKRPYIFL